MSASSVPSVSSSNSVAAPSLAPAQKKRFETYAANIQKLTPAQQVEALGVVALLVIANLPAEQKPAALKSVLPAFTKSNNPDKDIAYHSTSLFLMTHKPEGTDSKSPYPRVKEEVRLASFERIERHHKDRFVQPEKVETSADITILPPDYHTSKKEKPVELKLSFNEASFVALKEDIDKVLEENKKYCTTLTSTEADFLAKNSGLTPADPEFQMKKIEADRILKSYQTFIYGQSVDMRDKLKEQEGKVKELQNLVQTEVDLAPLTFAKWSTFAEQQLASIANEHYQLTLGKSISLQVPTMAKPTPRYNPLPEGTKSAEKETYDEKNCTELFAKMAAWSPIGEKLSNDLSKHLKRIAGLRKELAIVNNPNLEQLKAKADELAVAYKTLHDRFIDAQVEFNNYKAELLSLLTVLKSSLHEKAESLNEEKKLLMQENNALAGRFQALDASINPGITRWTSGRFDFRLLTDTSVKYPVEVPKVVEEKKDEKTSAVEETAAV